jgi:hypothetical protein
MCDSKKSDLSAAKKPAVVIPKELKRLQEGHKCKNTKSLITEITIKSIEDKIKA